MCCTGRALLTQQIEHVRFVKELLAGIEGVPEDDTMVRTPDGRAERKSAVSLE